MLGSKTVYDKYVFYRLSVVLLGTHLENEQCYILSVDESTLFNRCETIWEYPNDRDEDNSYNNVCHDFPLLCSKF